MEKMVVYPVNSLRLWNGGCSAAKEKSEQGEYCARDHFLSRISPAAG